MKHQILIITILAIISEITANCGCLKCNKDLQIVSPPYHPYQIITKGGSSCGSPNPLGYQQYQGPAPAFQPFPATYQPGAASYIPLSTGANYHHIGSLVNAPCQPVYAYKYKAQAPLPAPPPPPPLTGLRARPDRLVLQRPNCPIYTGDDGECGDIFRPPCVSIFNDGYYGAPLPLQHLQLLGAPKTGPIVQPLTDDVYKKISCDCRYDHRRKKRELPILRKSVQFVVGLLPMFLRFPIEHMLMYHRGGTKPNGVVLLGRGREVGRVTVGLKPSETFLEKLQRVNERAKRAVVLDGEGIRLPFLKVTDIENSLEDSEEDSDDDDDEKEQVQMKRIKYNPREEYLAPLNFNHLVPHSPIYYLLNAPIRFLHQFHKLGQQISPVFKSVPHVFVNSRKYLRNFGKNLRNDVLNFASDLIGDFDDIDVHNYKPRRFKRSLEQYQPEYTLVFGNQTQNSRKKRYILKVVDEDEVEQFLREKLGGLVELPEKPKKKEEKEKEKNKDSNRKKLVVEQLSPKVIIDNNGRHFVEFNGMKRPLFLHKKPEETQTIKKEHESEEDIEDVKEKINSIITQAKERVGQNVPVQHNVPNQMIKERINQILTEIQNLINLDFDIYSTIYSDLCKLQTTKDLLVKEWKKILIEDKSNDISSKIRLLDDFKELQILRDKSVEDIASILLKGSNFMTNKLIKMLVRLQKLQCIIYRVVEDFGERIKMGTEFDIRKEIKYVDYLSGLNFVVGLTKHDLENELKRERDTVLENEMKVLESLRKLLEESHEPQKLYEEAQILWEFKNVDKLQKDTILEMNGKISRGQKVRKELKILFDLMRQVENCEDKQKKLLEELFHKQRQERVQHEVVKTDNKNIKNEEPEEVIVSNRNTKSRNRASRRKIKPESTSVARIRNFPHKMIIEDKKPVRLVSNGYTMTAYKVSDGFD